MQVLKMHSAGTSMDSDTVKTFLTYESIITGVLSLTSVGFFSFTF